MASNTNEGSDSAEEDSQTEPEASAELSDEEAKANLGASSGIDRKKSIIGGIVAIVFLAIVFTRVIPQIGDYAEAANYIQAMTTAAMTPRMVQIVLFVMSPAYVPGAASRDRGHTLPQRAGPLAGPFASWSGLEGFFSKNCFCFFEKIETIFFSINYC